jgi:hypothetical protein
MLVFCSPPLSSFVSAIEEEEISFILYSSNKLLSPSVITAGII